MLVSNVSSHCSLSRCEYSFHHWTGHHLLFQVLDILNHILRSGVVDQNIDPTHFSHGGVHHLLAVLLAAQVGGKQPAFLTQLLDSTLRLIRILLLLWQVGDEARGALHREQNGSCTANTRVTACDDRPLAGQFAGGLVSLISIVLGWELGVGGFGFLQFRLETGSFLVLDWDLMAWEMLGSYLEGSILDLTLLELRLRPAGGSFGLLLHLG